MFSTKYLSLAFLASTLVSAQTYTQCNPLTSTTCPADPGIDSNVWYTDFTQSSSLPAGWIKENQGAASYGPDGISLSVAAQGDSPTLVSSGYILFGSMEVVMKAAPGQGIVSSLILLSDDLDELDWELIGSNNNQVQSNYFGKGDTSVYNRAAWHNVANPQGTFHSYKFDWTPQAVVFSIDGVVVRTLNYADAQGGARFPQTPMKVKLGIWAGGDPSNGAGTIEWAGGLTNYGGGPYLMTIKSVTVVNYSPAQSYMYGDTSGSYNSIKLTGGTLMSNAGGAGNGGNSAAQSSGQSSAAATTSLSIASAPTQIQVTQQPSTTVQANTSKPTGSATVLPSTMTTATTTNGSGSSSGASSPAAKSTGAAAAAPTAATLAGMGGAALALGMALLA